MVIILTEVTIHTALDMPITFIIPTVIMEEEVRQEIILIEITGLTTSTIIMVNMIIEIRTVMEIIILPEETEEDIKIKKEA